MHKQQIAEQLRIHHAEFSHLLATMETDDYCYAPEGKWSAARQLDHLCKSVRPVNLAFSLPGFLLRLFFGTANRPSRSYEQLVEKYQAKLAAGGRASGPFLPAEARPERRAALLQQLNRRVESLASKVEQSDEDQLDRQILPHPLLGKLTLREMLYFTIYHVQHHQAAILRGLSSKNSQPTS
jgi:hypothetical protein